MSMPIHRQPSPRRRALVSVFAVLITFALFVIDVAFGIDFNSSILYPIVLLACFVVRDLRLLWVLVSLSIVLTLAAQPLENGDFRSLTHRIAMALTTLAAGWAFHYLLRAWVEVERYSESLASNNAELAAREEEIARQNEELQSQTEELERQSEELRVANEELARRERALAVLLELSRGLSIELTRSEALDRICQTLCTLLNGPDMHSAILERNGDAMEVVCHHGFGPDGIVTKTIAVEKSFGSLVFSHGRTGFIEDLSLRPDLIVPQPKSGPPVVSIICAPLKLGGEIIGSIEAYSPHRRTWTAEEVALIESLASQTTSTLRSERLFEEVVRERQRFETVFRTVPVGMSVLTASTNTIRLNPAGAALLGLPSDTDLAGAELFRQVRVFREGVEETDFQARRALDQASEVLGSEVEIVLRSGKRLSLLYSIAPLYTGDGPVDAAVSAFVDITPIKELQRELDVRRREAEEASVRKTRFLAAVSHDVRTPANAISLLAELIRRTANQPGREAEIAEMAKELHSSAMALVSLLGDVLDVTRFDAGRIEVQESEFELRGLLEMEARHLMPLARDKKIAFEIDDCQSIWLRADKVKLARVVGNLVGNAIKFTEAGKVVLSCNRREDGRIAISVTDTGIGIAAEHLQYIFDEFFQLRNPERDRNKGNGLGLTICKRLADAMGAELTVESKLHSGSTFSLILPTTASAIRN